MFGLWGRASSANVELHDVRWVVGSKIKDTFNALRKVWFGTFEGLYIDSYKKIKYVDGYRINLRNIENNKFKNNKFLNGKHTNKNLWFVNIGGYETILCKKNMNLVKLLLQVNLRQKSSKILMAYWM